MLTQAIGGEAPPQPAGGSLPATVRSIPFCTSYCMTVGAAKAPQQSLHSEALECEGAGTIRPGKQDVILVKARGGAHGIRAGGRK